MFYEPPTERFSFVKGFIFPCRASYTHTRFNHSARFIVNKLKCLRVYLVWVCVRCGAHVTSPNGHCFVQYVLAISYVCVCVHVVTTIWSSLLVVVVVVVGVGIVRRAANKTTHAHSHTHCTRATRGTVCTERQCRRGPSAIVMRFTRRQRRRRASSDRVAATARILAFKMCTKHTHTHAQT